VTIRPRIQIVLIGVVWCVVAALCFLRWHAPVKGGILGGMGAVFVLSGLAVPSLALIFHRALGVVTQQALAGITWLLLGLCYYLLITPLGLLLRSTGSLKTAQAGREARDSYWADRPQTPLDVSRYLRPF
jgi:hypothetical protein